MHRKNLLPLSTQSTHEIENKSEKKLLSSLSQIASHSLSSCVSFSDSKNCELERNRTICLLLLAHFGSFMFSRSFIRLFPMPYEKMSLCRAIRDHHKHNHRMQCVHARILASLPSDNHNGKQRKWNNNAPTCTK